MANMPSLSTFPLAAVLAQARSLAGSSQVRSGLSLSAVGAGSLGVTVAAGTAWVDGTYVSSVGGTVTPGAASATLARYDLIVIASGAVVPSIVAGTAASAPVPPSLPSGALFLGYVFIGPGATDYTTQTTAFIADYTMPVTLPTGTAAAPALPPNGDLITGWAFPGTGRMQAVTGAVARNETTSAGHFVPVSTSITDLGTSTLRWRDVNVVSVRADVVRAGSNPVVSLSSVGLGHPYRFRITRDANASVPTGTNYIVTWNATVFDPASMHSSTTSASEVGFSVPGTYLIGLLIEWETNVSNARTAEFIVNGTNVIAFGDMDPATMNRQQLTTLYDFVSTDRLTVRLVQGTAASLSINPVASYAPVLWGVKVG